jgi:hypothetical protein
LLGLQRQQAVRAGSANVDCGDGFLRIRSGLDEAKAGVHHQRRPDDQHRVSLREVARGGIPPVARNALAEEHDIRLQDASALPAWWDLKGREFASFEVSISVRRLYSLQVDPTWIKPIEFDLQFGPWRPALTSHAAHLIKSAVQVDHMLASTCLMKPVDVLGHQDLGPAHWLQACEGAMGIVWSDMGEMPQADHAACPIALAGDLTAHEDLIGHRGGPLPVAGSVAIIRDAARAAASTCQDEEATMAINEVFEIGERSRRSKRAFWRRHLGSETNNGGEWIAV